MFLEIYCNRSGQQLVLRRLAPNETLDVREHVRRWIKVSCSDDATASFSERGTYIPNGCGEYQATIRRTKNADFAVVWCSEAFYIL